MADEVADRFSIVGPPEEHVRRLLELHEAGVDQFNVYLMNGDEEAQLDAYGRDVIPAFRAALGQTLSGGPHAVAERPAERAHPESGRLWHHPRG